MVENSRFKFLVFPTVFLGTAVMLFSAIYTTNRAYQPTIAFRLGTWIVKNSCSYFSFKIEFEDIEAVEKAGPSLFIVEPHSVFPMTLFWGTLDVLPCHKMLCCASSSIFLIPMAKHILTWAGAVSADKKTMIKYLREGFSLNICPGGVQEVRYLANKGECVMFLKTRTGIIRLALEQGVKLVPSVSFGLHKAYDYYVFDSNFTNLLARKFGFFPMVFFGLFGIPFGQAKPCPLTVVVGKPITVPHIAVPTADDIKKYQDIFLQAMKDLYESNKTENGMGDIALRII
jgi:1-acyl-sn-glycerol-3-phosphate acyltransferase